MYALWKGRGLTLPRDAECSVWKIHGSRHKRGHHSAFHSPWKKITDQSLCSKNAKQIKIVQSIDWLIKKSKNMKSLVPRWISTLSLWTKNAKKFQISHNQWMIKISDEKVLNLQFHDGSAPCPHKLDKARRPSFPSRASCCSDSWPSVTFIKGILGIGIWYWYWDLVLGFLVILVSKSRPPITLIKGIPRVADFQKGWICTPNKTLNLQLAN